MFLSPNSGVSKVLVKDKDETVAQWMCCTWWSLVLNEMRRTVAVHYVCQLNLSTAVMNFAIHQYNNVAIIKLLHLLIGYITHHRVQVPPAWQHATGLTKQCGGKKYIVSCDRKFMSCWVNGFDSWHRNCIVCFLVFQVRPNKWAILSHFSAFRTIFNDETATASQVLIVCL